MTDYNLNIMENAVFSYVLSLSESKGFCYASNKHICDSLNIKDRTLYRVLSSLEQKEFIKRVTKSIGHDGKERKIYIHPKYRSLVDTQSVT